MVFLGKKNFSFSSLVIVSLRNEANIFPFTILSISGTRKFFVLIISLSLRLKKMKSSNNDVAVGFRKWLLLRDEDSARSRMLRLPHITFPNYDILTSFSFFKTYEYFQIT